ncbi:bacteriohemerythrin [Geomonas sp.]|uniref:bacteriohemerythrin n=1 Tax=Geomonas sp. TaxID=2651584 RepID=UPI002B46F54A|nr:bacteriohemerythrin [Geomonas sp.]HJV35909.1 bacteriohemerythrin [Geomonas sp.]
MAYFTWEERFAVNVKEIDEQHKTLVNLLNTLYDAMVANKGRAAHKEIIYSMVEYARVHFETEEKYMRRTSYPEFHEHRTEHEKFTTKALDLKQRADNEAFILTLEIMNFLKDWLQNHILVTDSRYSGHFEAHGIS